MSKLTAELDDKEFLGLAHASPSELGFSPDRLARIGKEAERFTTEGVAPCVLTAVSRRGKIAHFETVGCANVETRDPLKSDTIFRWYSMTKPVTAVAVMSLFEEGSFLLDDPITEFLPEFRRMRVFDESGSLSADQEITIRHLLTHTSGLTYSMVPDVPAVASMYQGRGLNEALSRLGGRTLETHVSALSELPLIAQPGSAWHYSEGFSVLARIVEVVTGRSYRTFLKERILTPLNMNDTDYVVPPEKANRLAILYTQDESRGFSPTDSYGGDYAIAPPLEAGGVGLAGTAGDYLRFAQMLLNGGALDGVRILSPASVRLLFSNHLAAKFGSRPLPSVGTFSGVGVGFGLGGAVVTDAVASGTLGSNGEYFWGGWANTAFWIDPMRELIGLAFTQLIPFPKRVLSLRAKIHQLVYQALIE